MTTINERARIELDIAYTGTWQASCRAPHPDARTGRSCRRERGHRLNGTPCASGLGPDLLIWTTAGGVPLTT